MNQLEMINSQLVDINNKRVKYQTLKEQAQKQVEEIQKKYNITTIEELKSLVDKAQAEYDKSVQDAQNYIEETNKIFASYQGVL